LVVCTACWQLTTPSCLGLRAFDPCCATLLDRAEYFGYEHYLKCNVMSFYRGTPRFMSYDLQNMPMDRIYCSSVWSAHWAYRVRTDTISSFCLGGAGAGPRTGRDCFHSFYFIVYFWPIGLGGAGAGPRTGSNYYTHYS